MRSSRNITMSRGESVSQGVDKLLAVREEKTRAELHRVRNTFSFRLGLLLTESFIRKPWLFPLLPFRFIRLFFHKTEPYLPRISTPSEHDRGGAILLFSASEDGMASIERCEALSNDYAAKGTHVIQISTSIHAHRLTDDDVPVFTLPDPKSKTNLNTKEWNETCLDLIVSIVESNNVGTIIFDGPYPYRGVLNALEIYPSIHSVWRRPAYSPATNTEQMNRFDLVEVDWLDSYPVKQTTQSSTKKDGDRLHLLMGLGYDKRTGVAKRTPAIISHLKRLPRMRISMPEHLAVSESALGITTISRWDRIASHPNLSTLDAAIIPPEPLLIRHLTDRQVPTLIVTSGNLDQQHVTELRRLAQHHPLLVLDDPDGEDLRLALGTLVSGTMQAGRVLPRTG